MDVGEVVIAVVLTGGFALIAIEAISSLIDWSDE